MQYTTLAQDGSPPFTRENLLIFASAPSECEPRSLRSMPWNPACLDHCGTFYDGPRVNISGVDAVHVVRGSLASLATKAAPPRSHRHRNRLVHVRATSLTTVVTIRNYVQCMCCPHDTAGHTTIIVGIINSLIQGFQHEPGIESLATDVVERRQVLVLLQPPPPPDSPPSTSRQGQANIRAG
jgi:hypothetical protein